VRYWILTGILLFAYLIQSVVAIYLSIGNITPDIMLVVVLSYGLLFGWEVGLVAGVVGGLLVDLTFSRYIGLHVLSLALIGLVAGLVEEKVFKDNLLLAPIAGFLGSLASHSILMLVLALYGWKFDLFESLRTTIVPSALYDMVIAVVVYGRIYKYYLYLRPDPRGTIVVRRR
jgi:rod shape-determining protein MreD